VSQSNISATRLKGFSVPLPSLEEQAEIIQSLDTLNAKRICHQQRRDLLQDLFRTLLHQLMTAQIRVDKVDLSELKAIGIDVD
jgi:type I restriction enzyme S subunit